MAKDNNIQDDVFAYEDDFIENQIVPDMNEEDSDFLGSDMEQLLGINSMFYPTEEGDIPNIDEKMPDMMKDIPNMIDNISDIDMSMEGILSDMEMFTEERSEDNSEDLASNNPEDDIFSLLGQIKTDDPFAEDIQAISAMLSGALPTGTESKGKQTDVGDVFNNALRAVSSLEDQNDIEKLLHEEEISKGKKKTKKEKQIKEKKDKVKKDKVKKVKEARVKKERVKKPKDKKENLKKITQGEVDTVAVPKPPKKSAKVKNPDKKSLMDVLFGPEDEEDVKKLDELAATKSKSKGSAKNAIKRLGKNDYVAEEANDIKGSAKKSAAQKTKATKKVKVKKIKNEKIRIIDEFSDDGSKINPIGASVVFIFFGVLVMVLLIGTNIFSYSLSIQNATSDFSRNRYNQAYNEVYGIDIKDEDIEIYDKIMTVMFVNKQLNSYNNFYAMRKYPEALDSLLKGLERYDKYYELASILGIDSDLDYVRDKILIELETVFGLSEKQALKILKSKDQTTYSIKVYDTVFENMKRDE